MHGIPESEPPDRDMTRRVLAAIERYAETSPEMAMFGHTKSVFVCKLIAADTVKERILELQKRKATLASIAFSEEGSGAARNGRPGHGFPVRCGPQPAGGVT